MAECRIPGHITGLYIFAVVNLCALLNISLVSAEVFVLDIEKNSTQATFKDKQAMFGPDFPEEGLVGRVVYVLPNHNACGKVYPPSPEVGVPWIALISRGPCHFDLKVWNAQKAGYAAAIVHNYNGSENLIPMGGDSSYADEVKIPSVFVGHRDGMELAGRYNYTHRSIVIKIREDSDETPASFFLPFVVVVSLCFLGVVVFSIIKCVKYLQHIRRTRLSKSALKKIPTRKYKKGDHYDTCAICLEDYEEGEKVRVLPCNHTYHCKCIDPWLTKRKKTCPQCKRRVIPGHDTDSDSDGEEEGASETTPLLSNNNNQRPGTSSSSGRRSRPSGAQGSGEGRGRRSQNRPPSSFDRSGLPAGMQQEVVVISEGGPANSAGQSTVEVAVEGADHPALSWDQEGEEELEGAVGGVGISDQQGDEEDVSNVVYIEVEPPYLPSRGDPDLADDLPADDPRDSDDPTGEHAPPAEEGGSLAPAQGSINGAFTTSVSSEEEGAGSNSSSGSNGSGSGRRGKKRQRRNNQVV